LSEPNQGFHVFLLHFQDRLQPWRHKKTSSLPI
jgi:hypothetical protein